MKNAPKLLAVFLPMLSLIASPGSAQPPGHRILYVNHAAGGAQDGLTWKTACRSLQSALAKAASGDEIWVARGVYYPDASDATKSFRLKEGVAVYGGFAGTEARLDQRNYRKHTTTLSGNIGKGDRTRNTHTILMGADNAILDGFTIADAYATDKVRMHLVPADILKNDMTAGGGMRNFMVSPVVRNCVFKNNFSPKGGAVYNVHKPGKSQAAFINVEFTGNTGQLRGGAVSNDLGAMPCFINCRFINNRSSDKGGGLYNDFASSPFLFNCLFKGNSAETAGAIGNDGGSAPLLVNVTIAGNKARSGLGAGLYQGTGANNNPILINTSVDNIYNWHEDVVAVVGSSVPENQTLPLAGFLQVSNLKGQLNPADLKSAPATGIGYQTGLNGETLIGNGLVKKLAACYIQNGGAVKYAGEYSRPVVNRARTPGPVVYVVPVSSSKVQDGRSWSTGFTDLQRAIETASLAKAAVWIKAGTYRPARKEARVAAFILYDGVKLYGGFAGTEKSFGQRPAAGAKTILSARTLGGYRYPHVLYGADQVVLDGFTYQGKGGGLLAYHAGKTFLPREKAVGFSMEINNCRFEQNTALEGGAIYAFGKAVLSISNTVFEDNSAVYGGAIMDREGNQITSRQCAFIANRASQDGGATYEDYGSHAGYSEVRFAGNGARRNGGAIYEISRASQLEATILTLDHCTFSKNVARQGASVFNLDQSDLTIKESKYPAGSVHNPKATTGR